VAGWADQLLLRASTEHILIVRGLRARKLVAHLALTATPTKSFQLFFPSLNSCRDGRGRPHVRASNDIHAPSKLARFSLGMGAD
jgi:hypothetical protein